MAKIQKVISSQEMQLDRIPDTARTTDEADALGRLGGAVGNVAAAFLSRAQDRENFKADNDYKAFQLRMQSALEEQTANMPTGGAGFHDQFMDTNFNPQREEFLNSVPERLRGEFETMLADEEGADWQLWSKRAASAERDELYRYQARATNDTHLQLAGALSLDPERYDEIFQAGIDAVNATMLPGTEKDNMIRQWEHTAQIVHLNQLLSNDPHRLLRELGVDARQLSPKARFEVVRQAVVFEEIAARGNGALAQMSQFKAAEIAQKLDDKEFPFTGGEAAIRQYLAAPDIAAKYGDAYLRDTLETFKGDQRATEATLIALMSDEDTANAWIASGYNDDLLPKDVKDYRDRVMNITKSPVGRNSPDDVVFMTGDKPRDMSDTNPDLLRRASAGFAAAGLLNVKVRSTARSEERNKEVGGAEHSQHITGNAFDVDLTGVSNARRVEIIRALSAAGVTGIGIYTNGIHVDGGGRRAWGPDHSAGSVPAWAEGVVAEHLSGSAAPALSINNRFGSLPFNERQNFVTKADSEVARRAKDQNRANVVERTQMRSSIKNEIATVRATGVATDNFDETRIATVLGEDDYVEYAHDVHQARRMFVATEGISTMPPEEMAQLLDAYDPTPGSDSFADDTALRASVLKEITRVTKMRGSRPGAAALELPQLADTRDSLQEQFNTNPAAVDPAEVQGFVAQMLDVQSQFGVPRKAQAPIPFEWAMTLGRAMANLPELGGDNSEEVRAAITALYTDEYELFGDYTDEVLVYALSVYRGGGENTSKLVVALMEGISAGGDPLGLSNADGAVDRAEDRDQVEGFGVDLGDILQFLIGPFGSSSDPHAASSDEIPEDITPEQMLRVIEGLRNADGPEDEAVLVQRYGQKAVDAAKRREAGGE